MAVFRWLAKSRHGVSGLTMVTTHKKMTNEARHHAEQEAMRIMNKVARELGLFGSRQPNYRYYAYDKVGDRYFYTTTKINRNGRPRFVSGIYRYLKTKKQWKLLKEAGHAKRRDADERAERLYKAHA